MQKEHLLHKENILQLIHNIQKIINESDSSLKHIETHLLKSITDLKEIILSNNETKSYSSSNLDENDASENIKLIIHEK